MTSDSYAWFRTDSYIELHDAIEFTHEHISRFPNDSASVRWAIIGSVLALQSACIYQLDGHDSTGTSVLDNKSQMKVCDWHNSDWSENYPKKRLASSKDLLERVQKTKETTTDFSQSWTNEDHKNCFYLIDLRNEFIHFIPQGWSHALNGLPAQLLSCWSIIDLLISSPILYQHRISAAVLSKSKMRAIATVNILRDMDL
ncbi:hypothetical protein [Hirschia maritima]|uniref:hypothetical protein n=1 Tax=Hirschia maritima TaxID=1121961 RepID=UPI00036D62ED|nr:hypothetical protein [Hirschia maritima]